MQAGIIVLGRRSKQPCKVIEGGHVVVLRPPYRSQIFFLFLQKTWAHVQTRRSYTEFVAEFNRLTPEDIVWEPYSPSAIAARTPFGISSVCTQDQGLWTTTAALVYDVAVEAHCPDSHESVRLTPVFPCFFIVGSCSAPRS